MFSWPVVLMILINCCMVSGIPRFDNSFSLFLSVRLMGLVLGKLGVLCILEINIF